MQVWLRVIHAKANLQRIQVLPQLVVGRSPDCHLRIASPQVSRKHCEILLRHDGIYLEDLGSANGTSLDGAPLPPHTPTYIHDGATLEIGPAKFVVEYQQATRQSAEPRVPQEPTNPGDLFSDPRTQLRQTVLPGQAETTTSFPNTPSRVTGQPAKRFVFGLFGRSAPAASDSSLVAAR